jgi:hypothetical protein
LIIISPPNHLSLSEKYEREKKRASLGWDWQVPNSHNDYREIVIIFVACLLYNEKDYIKLQIPLKNRPLTSGSALLAFELMEVGSESESAENRGGFESTDELE